MFNEFQYRSDYQRIMEYGKLDLYKWLCFLSPLNIRIDFNDTKDESLIIASEHGFLDVVKYLVENGANIHADDESALEWAIIENNYDVVKYLIDKGANPTVKNGKFLIDASSFGYPKNSRIFIKKWRRCTF